MSGLFRAVKKPIAMAVGALELDLSADIDGLRNDLSSSAGAGRVGFLQAGAGAVPRTMQDKARETVSVKDFGAVGDGVTDDTAAIQLAIDEAWKNHSILRFPTGTYLVTETINVYEGTQIIGSTKFQYPKGFGKNPKATGILFQPSSVNSDLFSYNWKDANPPEFIFHTSIEGLYIESKTTNSRYGINLNGVIYGRFANIGFEGPWMSSIYCYATINNRFENIYARGDYCAVTYAGNNETTDVWEQCTFWGSSVGVRFEGSSIGVRFNSCLWEQIDFYGIDIHSQCQSISVTNGYCEDVPNKTGSDGCMFRVGLHTGSSATHINNHLIVTGGVFNGRSAGLSGQLFSIGNCWGIIVSGIAANRWPILFKTDPTGTKPRSIVILGIEGIGWGGVIDDATKCTGLIPNGVLNTGYFGINVSGSNASFINTNTGTLTCSQVIPGVGWYPNTDGVAFLGLSNLRWNTIYSATGTINTSDKNKKQQIKKIDENILNAWGKVEYCQFKFNDAVIEKSNGARWHFGVIAQQIKEVFESAGINPFEYGVLCYDKWDDIFDDDGKLITKAGESYGIRYEEALILESAFLRSKLEGLK